MSRFGGYSLILCLALAGVCRAQSPTIALAFDRHRLLAEVAATPEARASGLMNRRALPADRGMLFVFPRADRECMWMKDTLIPLSVAFIDDWGRVRNLADMLPMSRRVHCSSGPARYALEMNQGWFASRGVKPGARLSGLEAAPAPR